MAEEPITRTVTGVDFNFSVVSVMIPKESLPEVISKQQKNLGKMHCIFIIYIICKYCILYIYYIIFIYIILLKHPKMPFLYNVAQFASWRLIGAQ